jgi:ribosomal protein S18 acetylase RimI-like enzyme
MQIAIRRYEERDAEEAARLWFESWRSTGLAVAQRASQAAMRARFAQELASGWSAYVACDDNGSLVGFLALKLDTGRLDQIFVSPSAQGQGVGLALLDFAKQRMPEGIWLRTAVDNVRACRFYEQSGFKLGETSTHPTLGHRTVIYRWP